MRTGIATMTLDYGRCPKWLFEKMVRLSRIIGLAIVEEFGSEEFLRRLADPAWFQSVSCVIGMDWNASGTTTITIGALKEAFRGLEQDYGLFICGGKGKTSRKTPDQIVNWSWTIGFDQETSDWLVYSSRASAKVDSALVQDGFTLYHHSFIFNKKGQWAVVQQGMNTQIGRARRYHWLGDSVDDFIEEPHTGIATQARLPQVLDLTSSKSQQNRKTSLAVVADKKNLYRSLKVLADETNKRKFRILDLPGIEFYHHPVEDEFLHPNLKRAIDKAIVSQPSTFEKLLMTEGVGSKTIRALSLIAEVIYGAKPSYEDPARYSFSFGGKDGTPYPVDRQTYDKTLTVLERAVKKSNLGIREKETALRKVNYIYQRQTAVFKHKFV